MQTGNRCRRTEVGYDKTRFSALGIEQHDFTRLLRTVDLDAGDALQCANLGQSGRPRNASDSAWQSARLVESGAGDGIDLERAVVPSRDVSLPTADTCSG
jgi:hypothetical protein